MIDTAHLYSSGESERTIGAALAPFGDELVVATQGRLPRRRIDRLRAEIEESFERLRTDVDRPLLPAPRRPRGGAAAPSRCSREYHEAGRIRNVGLSEVAVEEHPPRPQRGADRRGPERVQPRSAQARRGGRLLRGARGSPSSRSSRCAAAAGPGRRDRGAPRRDPPAGQARLAAAPLRGDAADPGHALDRAPRAATSPRSTSSSATRTSRRSAPRARTSGRSRRA